MKVKGCQTPSICWEAGDVGTFPCQVRASTSTAAQWHPLMPISSTKSYHATWPHGLPTLKISDLKSRSRVKAPLTEEPSSDLGVHLGQVGHLGCRLLDRLKTADLAITYDLHHTSQTQVKGIKHREHQPCMVIVSQTLPTNHGITSKHMVKLLHELNLKY
jgi:hypothetical protein